MSLQWEFSEKAQLDLPQDRIDENLYLQVYQQMLESGQTRSRNYRADRSYLKKTDPYWALRFLSGWFVLLKKGAETDFHAAGDYNAVKPTDKMFFKDIWLEAMTMLDMRMVIQTNLACALEVYETQMKHEPVAFPAPLATHTIYHAVTAAQAIRPYLDGSKTLAVPQHASHMWEIFTDITNMITFIGTCSGLHKQMIEDLKSEVIAPSAKVPQGDWDIRQILDNSPVAADKVKRRSP